MSDFQILEPKCVDLEKKLKAAHTVELDLKEDIKRLLEEVAHLKSSSTGSIEELQDALAKQRAELSACKLEISSLKERLSEADYKRKTLEAQAVESEAQIDRLEKQLRGTALRQQVALLSPY